MKIKKLTFITLVVSIFIMGVCACAASNSARYTYSGATGVYYSTFLSMTGLPLVNDEAAYTVQMYGNDKAGCTVAMRLYTDLNPYVRARTIWYKAYKQEASGVKVGSTKTSWGKIGFYEKISGDNLANGGYKKYSANHTLKADTD